MSLSEHERIEVLRGLLSGRPIPGLTLGIGDDAAVLSPVAESLVWTVDAAVEGVHFRFDLLGPRAVGYRATMAAASDLGAMGARPLGLLSSLILPPTFEDEALFELARGQREAAEALGTAVVGGNLARGPSVSITTTALGAASTPLTRSGARAGDELWLCGAVGLAAAGLALLLEGRREPLTPAEGLALESFLRPRARIPEGLELAEKASAAIDLSDGLAQDLGHLVKASGVSARLEPRTLVSEALREVASSLGRDPLRLALEGGEDYALLFSAPPGAGLEGDPRWSKIGSLHPCEAGPPLALAQEDGDLQVLRTKGWDHFRSTP